MIMELVRMMGIVMELVMAMVMELVMAMVKRVKLAVSNHPLTALAIR